MKYKFDNFTDNEKDLIFDKASDWMLANDLFWEDFPTCLDDDVPKTWENWLQEKFPAYVDEGYFYDEIQLLLKTTKK